MSAFHNSVVKKSTGLSPLRWAVIHAIFRRHLEISYSKEKFLGIVGNKLIKVGNRNRGNTLLSIFSKRNKGKITLIFAIDEMQKL